MMFWVLGAVVVAVGTMVGRSVLPDLARYFKIRKM